MYVFGLICFGVICTIYCIFNLLLVFAAIFGSNGNAYDQDMSLGATVCLILQIVGIAITLGVVSLL